MKDVTLFKVKDLVEELLKLDQDQYIMGNAARLISCYTGGDIDYELTCDLLIETEALKFNEYCGPNGIRVEAGTTIYTMRFY